MIREERTSFLAGLTLVIYAGIQWVEKGAFLFPFPLNEIVVFFVFIYFLFLNKWKITRINFTLGSAILFKMLSQQLFWSFFLSNVSLEILYSGIWTDLFYLMYAISWFWFAVLYLRKNENSISYLTIGVVLIPFVLGVIMNLSILEVFSNSLIIALAWYYKIDRINRSLVSLIIFLEIGKFVMLL